MKRLVQRGVPFLGTGLKDLICGLIKLKTNVTLLLYKAKLHVTLFYQIIW